MAIKGSYASCSECGFPVSGSPGQAVSCPNCHTTGKISGDVKISDVLFYSVLAFIAGILVGPAVIRWRGKIQKKLERE